MPVKSGLTGLGWVNEAEYAGEDFPAGIAADPHADDDGSRFHAHHSNKTSSDYHQ